MADTSLSFFFCLFYFICLKLRKKEKGFCHCKKRKERENFFLFVCLNFNRERAGDHCQNIANFERKKEEGEGGEEES